MTKPLEAYRLNELIEIRAGSSRWTPAVVTREYVKFWGVKVSSRTDPTVFARITDPNNIRSA